MMNSNWSRWIFASTSKYFYDRINQALPLLIEGQDPKGFVDKNHCEFRLNGPDGDEISKDNWKLSCTINIILNIFKGTNYHQIQKYSGIIQNSFNSSIPIFRYGKETGDDSTYLGCLEINSRIENLQLGEFDNLNQSTINASYKIYLDA